MGHEIDKAKSMVHCSKKLNKDQQKPKVLTFKLKDCHMYSSE